VGDRVLRTACENMQRQLRRTDAFGRYGGDEFIAVLPETSLRDGAEIAQRMCDALSSREIECGELTLRVSASIGVASTDGSPCERETILKWADRALFRAKAAGGNQVTTADPETREPGE
jgi:diguanylate cyclase (GGDEF)-like protein